LLVICLGIEKEPLLTGLLRRSDGRISCDKCHKNPANQVIGVCLTHLVGEYFQKV